MSPWIKEKFSWKLRSLWDALAPWPCRRLQGGDVRPCPAGSCWAAGSVPPPQYPPLSRLILRKRWGSHRVLTPTGWEGVSEGLNSRRFSSELLQTLCSLSCSKCHQVAPRCKTNLELWGDHAGFWETSHSLSRAPKWLLQSHCWQSWTQFPWAGVSCSAMNSLSQCTVSDVAWKDSLVFQNL